MSEQQICQICNKPRATPHPAATFDYGKFCAGLHASVTYAPIEAFLRIGPQDLNKIRTIFREELERIRIEQEQKLDELFNPPKHDGQLNDDDTHHVYYNGFGGIAISTSSGIPVTAQEALSLRDWLIQESNTLAKLAMEQEYDQKV